jgi:hypothetical protein
MTNNDLKNKILESIKRGEVKMRPRWHFVLRSTLFALGCILVFLATLYISSFIIFALHKNGIWFASVLGAQGLRVLLSSLPWVLILLAVLFIALLEFLVKKSSFGYRRPLLYSALVVIFVTVLGGSLIASTTLHDRISGSFYKSFIPQVPENVVVCNVATTTEDSFSCAKEDRDDATTTETFEVKLSPKTRMSKSAQEEITSGATVVIFGERDKKGEISAKGIKNIDDFKRRHKVGKPEKVAGHSKKD